MADSRPVFLTAEWRHLAMLNFEVDPALVRPLVPAGTELDDYHGRTFVSLVGFMFLNTRVLGIAIPRHRDFEEVNLRFYVRRRASDGWRRAVVFVKELVPRAAIAVVARAFYGENYLAVPMSHRIAAVDEGAGAVRHVSYRWRFKGHENELRVTAQGEASEIAAGSQEEFITEHYWGYTCRRRGGTLEYQVEHPRWRAWTAVEARLEGNTAGLYGDQFAQCLKGPPASAFLADGSEVRVFKRVRLQ